MKKTYVLLLVMVLSLMTAGFSYAYWSDTLTVSGTAETGELDVGFVYAKEFIYADRDSMKYIEMDVVFDEDVATITASNLYPGAQARTTLKIRNFGSIPATLTNIKLTAANLPTCSIECQEELTKYVTIWLNPEPDDGTGRRLKLDDEDNHFYERVIWGEDFTYQVWIEVHKDANNLIQDKTVTFQLSLVFDQWNNPDNQLTP